MRAMVFAAGLGTRLRPLTDVLPKPVIPLLHRPLCAYAIEHLARNGATHVVLNTHHLADRVERALAGSPTPLAFAREPRLLGTGGGVKNAIAHQSRVLGSPLAADELVVAFNGDILFAPDLARAIALHRSRDAYATMILRADPDAARYGAIELDHEDRVRRLLGQPDLAGLRPFMFTGVHVLSARAIADLPDEGCIVRQGYRGWVARGEVVLGHVEASPWRDLGTPREYLAASLDLLHGPAPGPAIHPGALVDPAASLEDAVVGEGARVGAGVTLRRVIVWPGTRVRESAQDAILFGESVVEAR